MASTFSELKIELIGTGEQSGTWGDTTNVNLGTALGEAITGVGSAVFTTDADLALTWVDTNAAQTARNLVLNVTSTVSLTTTRNLVVPTIEKQYLIWNNTTGGRSIVVKTSAGTGVTVLNGTKAHVIVDGTNVVQAVTQLTNPVLYPTAAGTTAGQLGYASGVVTFGNGALQRTVATLEDTQTLTNKTTSGLIINDGYTEEVYAVSGTTPALSPNNGSIQTWTLTGNSTPTSGAWNSGQSITLMVDDGTSYTITWTSMSVVWKTDAGAAPALIISGYTAITLWKVGTVIYGARVGNA